MPISATDTIQLAFQHTKRQLLQPFRFWQWARLAVVGLLAGELGSGFSNNFNSFRRAGNASQNPLEGLRHLDPALLVGMITVIVVAFVAFAVIMMYIASVMRFILFDSVLAKECHIRQGWNRNQQTGWRLFLWQLGFSLATFAVMIVLLGIPLGFAFAAGWFKAPREHLPGLILGGILLFFVLLFVVIIISLVHVLTKDFVVPQMALEGIGAVEGWRRLWRMIQDELSGYAIYVGMKIALAMGFGIVITIASLIIVLLVAIPAVGLGIVGVVTGKAAGLTWNAYTITAAIVVGCILFAVFMYLIALISVPAIVFFPAYSVYFFAARYRPLSTVLYPPPPLQPAIEPPWEPPPLPPPLEPIG